MGTPTPLGHFEIVERSRAIRRVDRKAVATLRRAVVGGLAASTVLTLVILPFFYTLLYDLAARARRVWQLSVPAPPAAFPAASPAAKPITVS